MAGLRCTPKNGSPRCLRTSSYSSSPVTPMPMVSYPAQAQAKYGATSRVT